MFRWMAAACVVVLAAGGAAAAPVGVDGVLGGGEYGMASATVRYDAAAPSGNFGTPGDASNAVGYTIYLKSTPGFVQGVLQADMEGGGVQGVATATLYFDLDPQAGNGADLAFELDARGQRAFVPGGAPVAVGNLSVAVSADMLTLEFAIPVADFMAPIAGLAYAPGLAPPGNGDVVVLALSQAFGPSVAGGTAPPYGPLQLGAVTLDVAEGSAGVLVEVPEPGTLALVGVGLLGLARRRRRAK